MSDAPALVVCMGVSGSGKSTLAQTLAERFGLEFLEADAFHSEENRQHMAAGLALTDAMREPWIERLCAELAQRADAGRGCVLAYSGLRRAHRARFRQLGFRTLFLHLRAERELIRQRMQTRSGHFAPPDLLDSQIADLQSTRGESDVVDVDAAPDWQCVAQAAGGAVAEFLQTGVRIEGPA